MKKHLVFLACLLSLALSFSFCHTNSELSNSFCPSDHTAKTTADPVKVDYLYPGFSSTCTDGGVEVNLSSGLPSGALFSVGHTEVVYTATDACGNSATCSFSVTVSPTDQCGHILEPSNPLTAFAGVYSGQLECNGAISTATQTVCLHATKNDHLMIGNDAVYLDTACQCYPNISIAGYRIYHAWFRNDSLFMNTDVGSLSSPYVCKYYLKKQ